MDTKLYLVLVVDDDSEVRDLTGRLLENNGFRVIYASNGLEALNLLDKSRPDVILLDIAMPILDGIEFLRLLLHNPTTASIPVILVTATDGPQVAKLHAFRVLSKPVDPVELLKEVKTCCLQSRAAAQVPRTPT